jgi:hypothetical protein
VVLIVWKLDLQLSVQSVFITTIAVSSNPVHGEVNGVWRFFYRNIPTKSMVVTFFVVYCFGLWCLSPLLTIFQLCRGGKLYW